MTTKIILTLHSFNEENNPNVMKKNSWKDVNQKAECNQEEKNVKDK